MMKWREENFEILQLRKVFVLENSYLKITVGILNKFINKYCKHLYQQSELKNIYENDIRSKMRQFPFYFERIEFTF
jgi:hypothetical protein